MKILSLTVENVYWFSQVLSITLLAGTVLLGGVALFTGKILNDRQSAQILGLETKLSEAKKEQADAERSLLELQSLIRDQRSIDWEKGKKILSGAPKGTVRLLYVPVNPDAHNLAHEMYRFLTEMGWSVSLPEEGKGQMPATGITIELSAEGWVPADASIPLGPMPEDAKALKTFLLEAVKGNPAVGMRASGRTSKDAMLVVIGPKY